MLRMATQLPSLKPIERLSPRVVRILGGNASKFTLQGTNTYLIGQGKDRILVDSGAGLPAWRASLEEAVASENVKITTAIITHWHHDHINGVPDILEMFPSAEIYKHDPAYTGERKYNPTFKGEPEKWKNIEDGQLFKVEGATLRALHSPGHARDHMALVLEEEDAMFTGDNVLGHGTAVFEDLALYISSLELMASKFSGRAYPGHGQVIEDGKGKIREYILHRKQREDQVLEVLGQASLGVMVGNGEMTAMEIVKKIYVNTPESLHQAAEYGLLAVLRKLTKEGKVTEVDGRWRLSVSASL